MRRRSQVLVVVVGAAAVLLASAPALGAAWLSAETAALSAGTIQHSPAIAVDPAAPSRAAVVADDGTVAPPPHTATATATDWSLGWSAPGSLPHSGSTSAGQADIAWGIDATGEQNVYAVELGGSVSSNNLCTGQSGVFFSASSNGGASYDQALPVANGSGVSEAIEPAIAVDRTSGRVYVAYARLDWGAPGCAGAPDASQIWLAYSEPGPGLGTAWTTRRVSPLATSGAAHYRSPAVAVLPDGRVVVAFRNDASSTPQIEAETCVSPSPGTNYCNIPSPGNVGPSVVVGDATAPSLVSGLVGPPTPSVVAAGGRVVVAWHASKGSAVRAFAAMSTNGGSMYGPALEIDPTGLGNQVAPQLAATAGGRVDVAYLWDAGSGSVQATAASAAPPLAGATSEAWAQPVVVQAVGASSTTPPITGQAAPLGRRLGVATAAVPASPLPATVVAFTDTSAGNQDVHVVGLLHGTTTPVIASQTVIASKNATTIVHVNGSDDDGDPLTWSTGAQPMTTGSSVTASDPARGYFAFRAANVVGTDTFEAVATDGVAGHEARTTINVKVVNDPPEVICPQLVTTQDTPLDIPVAACVRDPNDDPLTVDLDGATGGTVERVAGTWRFVPAPHSTATGSFVLHVSDGELSAKARVIVIIAKPVGKVTIAVRNPGKRTIARGMAVRLEGHAVNAQGSPLLITWDFGDGTPPARGSAVAHRFRREGSFTVKASAGGTSVPIKVLVRRRAVELMGPARVADGVLQVRVLTRAAGLLYLRADSRSQTIRVPAGSSQRVLRIQVTTGPLVRLGLRLLPSRKTVLPMLSLRRLVLVSPRSAG